MNEQSKRQVPSLPILILCHEGEEEGEALLLSALRADEALLRRPLSLRVRRFKDADFKYAQELMGKAGIQRFVALTRLHSAIARKEREGIKIARDMLNAAAAYEHKLAERAERWSKALGTFKQRKQLASPYPKGSLEDEVYRMTHSGDLNDEINTLTTRYKTDDPVRLYATEMSGVLKNHVHLVLWLSGTRSMPALFCDDPVPAAYAFALFGRRWKVCPYSACGKWFVVTKAKQDYCCPKHREAYRVARWRERQKARAKRKN